jgi:uncharacterized membrane protein YgdD (TMEM256/DUF423 family)
MNKNSLLQRQFWRIAIIFGAFAHALKSTVQNIGYLWNWVRYQMYHALFFTLIIDKYHNRQSQKNNIIIGSARHSFLSGSIYLLATNDLTSLILK